MSNNWHRECVTVFDQSKVNTHQLLLSLSYLQCLFFSHLLSGCLWSKVASHFLSIQQSCKRFIIHYSGYRYLHGWLWQARVKINKFFKSHKFKELCTLPDSWCFHLEAPGSSRLLQSFLAPAAICWLTLVTESLVNPRHRPLSLHTSLLVQLTLQKVILCVRYLN